MPRPPPGEISGLACPLHASECNRASRGGRHDVPPHLRHGLRALRIAADDQGLGLDHRPRGLGEACARCSWTSKAPRVRPDSDLPSPISHLGSLTFDLVQAGRGGFPFCGQPCQLGDDLGDFAVQSDGATGLGVGFGGFEGGGQLGLTGFAAAISRSSWRTRCRTDCSSR